MNRPRPSAGFTLVELLTVIAIIGLLAALLMPGLTRSVGRAKNVVCLNQLKQLGTAVRLYSEDYQSRMPSAELLPSYPANTNRPLPRICDVLGPLLGRVPEATNSATVFKCPSDTFGRFAREGSSYEWNTDLNGRRLDETRTSHMRIVTVKVEEGKEPVKTDVIKELAFPPDTTPLLLDYEDFHPRPPKSGKNVVYMDGHVTGFELP
ncbi:MAG TPA: type II secretion system protein [Candidatus Limnocylindria bacterium]|nr:type II secretion system protein [Candidatus Limnocylindria bacterium]